MPSRSRRGTVVRARRPTIPKEQAITTSLVKQKSVNVQVTHPVSGNSPTPVHAHITDDDQQSPDIIQTFLFSAISTIFWMRDLLPDEYFRTVFYAAINQHCSYHDFTYGKDDADTSNRGNGVRPKGYHLRVLKRNASTRGDQMIEWLECGIFESIRLGYLSQLQIAIFADSKNPTEVLEQYIFHFKYLRSSKNGTTAVDLAVEDSQNKKTISLKDAREALNTVIKNMVILNGTMPHLPERCFMSPYLVWNEQRPSGYQPQGFHSSNDGHISFPATTGWALGTAFCGRVMTDSQCIDLGIAYTQGVASNDVAEAIVMPNFIYGEQLSRLELSHMYNSISQHQKVAPDGSTGALLTSDPSSVTRATTNVLARASPQEKGVTLENTGSTQDQEDLFRLKTLQPIEIHQTNDTQLVRRPSDSSQIMSSAEAPLKRQGNHGNATPSFMSVLQTSQSPGRITVSCECGTRSTSNAVQCHSCKNWQHLQCYAYEAADAPKLQAKHDCYTCLAKKTASKHGEEIPRLARTRQVVHCIQMLGLTSSAAIAETLGYDQNHVEDLLRELKQKDIVLTRKMNKKSGYLTLNSTEASKQTLLDEYLDPAKTIDVLVGNALEGDVAGRVNVHSSSRKRKDNGHADREDQPKTPRLSRAYSNLAFDSNFPYTPDHENMGNEAME